MSNKTELYAASPHCVVKYYIEVLCKEHNRRVKEQMKKLNEANYNKKS